MSETQTNDILNQILGKLNHIEEEIEELKLEKERYIWNKSLEFSLSKIWDNEADDEWNKLL